MPGRARPRDPERRKKITNSKVAGIAALLRTQTVLLPAKLLVQPVEGQRDIGRDAYVDLANGDEVAGGVVALQIKGGKSFFHKGTWVVPGDDADFNLWRESSVPMFGTVHDPETDALYWADLSSAARQELLKGLFIG